MTTGKKSCAAAQCVTIFISVAAWLTGSAVATGQDARQDAPAANPPIYVPTAEQLERSRRLQTGRQDIRGGIYKLSIAPQWSADGRYLWYRNQLPGEAREYVWVDAEQGLRRSAFALDALAAALTDQGLAGVEPHRLPIDEWVYLPEEEAWLLAVSDRFWRWHDASHTLSELETRPEALAPRQLSSDANVPRASRRTGPETHLSIVNRTREEVRLFWLDANGARRAYGAIATGETRRQHTFAGHVWEVVDSRDRVLGRYLAEEAEATVEVTGTAVDAGNRRERRPTPGGGRRGTQSPDGQWSYAVRDHHVYLRNQQTGEERQVSSDGSEALRYERLEWAPNSQALIAWRMAPAPRGEVHLIESSPADGGRARLQTRPYELPGDSMDAFELNLFVAPDWRQLKPPVDRLEFGRPALRWDADGRRFRYRHVDRGHQRLRIWEVDSESGDARALIDEQSDTFIWTAHGQRPFWLDAGEDGMIYSSERDGWHHLYWLDLARGTITHPITQGDFVVCSVDRVDPVRRQIWFQACGVYPDQDPYFIHFCRVNFDGSGFVILTAGNGTHAVQYSPDGRYLIDTYSRVDAPPVHELRRTDNGALVCCLEEADISAWLDRGGQLPEVFTAPGRDGATAIWGIICRPVPFDPTIKYPVIEDIYAGPHDAHVPKAFSARRWYADLTDLGFVVVKLDGMGTAHRSKAFHDVCWKNLKDAGFPDRIAWHRAAAALYPWYDAERVGIYGTSAGGQNAAGAVLFHSDFYRAAVAACGCHDNRMDKASWNEQWMGYPVGPHYADSSNIEHAAKLQGNLLLIVGELDTNVPPESTYRFVDALVKAGKDFEFLMIPGMGHSDGGPFGRRRLRDFFVRHLHGVHAQPP